MSQKVVIMMDNGKSTCKHECPFICSLCALNNQNAYDDLQDDYGAIYGQQRADDDDVYAAWSNSWKGGNCSGSNVGTVINTAPEKPNEYLFDGVILDVEEQVIDKEVKFVKGVINHG